MISDVVIVAGAYLLFCLVLAGLWVAEELRIARRRRPRSDFEASIEGRFGRLRERL